MKKLIILFVLFSSCVTVNHKKVVIVEEKIINGSGNCNYTLFIPYMFRVYLEDFPCDCYDVGDTIIFQTLNKDK